MSKILENLNEVQKKAVVSVDGPVMILAGAGSGKTRTLVSRIMYLLNDLQVGGYEILALTFSNKAAREMRERIARELKVNPESIQVTTFHSFCARVLRQEFSHIGLGRHFTIYDTSETKSVIKSLIHKRGLTTKEISPFEIMNYIETFKNEGFYEGRDESHLDEVLEVDPLYHEYYNDYESELHKANALDFGGIITGVLKLFETFPDILGSYHNRYKYILVDEYQDTNRAQFRLIELLAKKRRNICVVGDEDQSIYSWRGADIRNILEFEKIFPDVQVLKLEQNYRSSKNIIEAATSVVAKNKMRKGKNMWTGNDQGDSINIVECAGDKDEAAFLNEKICDLQSEGALFSDMAVFYRTNAQSRLLEDALRASGVPYRIVGGPKFYDRKEVKDLLAYLRIVVNEQDSLALSRIINVPARGIGALSLRKIEELAIDSNCSLWEALESLVDNFENYSHIRMSAKVKSGLTSFVELIRSVKQMDEQGADADVIYEKVLHESGYYEFLNASKDYESKARLENLEELQNAIKQFKNSYENPRITNFLETIALDNTKEDSETLKSGEVSLMTIHGAKGLEFPYVFITGAEENIFPSFRSLESGDDSLEEERRLFYVAMTRAMKKLYILFAQGRMLFGQVKFNGPSRFIFEIPDKYYSWEKYGHSKSSGSRSEYQNNEYDEFSQVNDYDTDVVYEVNDDRVRSQYPKGSRVVHGLYGEGKIVNTEGLGDDEKIVIQFINGTKKKFMVKFSPLTLL
jgi:DNA helicase II / ATP-dependent DNA helicase PcrA